MQNQIAVDLQIKSVVWDNIKNIKNFSKKICRELILETELKDFLKNPQNRVEIGLSLVSDAQIKKINHEFRNKNKPTDILSFPFLDEKLIHEIGLKKILKNQQNLFLGDIVLSLETSRKEANSSGKNFHDHIAHLLLHSILHLLGFDHENKKDAQIMESLEIKILKKFNIANPYQC